MAEKLHLLEIQKRAFDKFRKAGGRQLEALPTGAGKTIVAIYTIQWVLKLNPSNKVLVVTPANLRFNTGSTLSRFYPEIKFTYPNKNTLLDDYKTKSVLIISFNFLRDYIEELKKLKFTLLMIDEFHYAKNKNSSTFRSLKEIAFSTKYCMGLTASPYSNTPAEFFTLVYLISKDPKILKYANKFINYKKKKVELPSGKVANRKYPYNIHYKFIFKKYVGKWIFWPSKKTLKTMKKPKPLTYLKKVPITKLEYYTYLYALNKVPEKLIVKLQKGTITNGELAKIRFWLAVAEQALLTPDAYIKGRTNKRPGSKIKYIAEKIKKDKKQAIVFSQFKENGVTVANRYFNSIGIKSVEYSGAVSKEERRQIEKDYNDGKIQVICLTMAGMEGINLPTATQVYFLSLYFNPEVLNQVQGRALRVSSHNLYVDVYWLLAVYTKFSVAGIGLVKKDTIDTWMMNIAMKKNEFRKTLWKVLGEQTKAGEKYDS